MNFDKETYRSITTASKASERGRLHPAIEKGTNLSRTQLIKVRGEQALREGATQAPIMGGIKERRRAFVLSIILFLSFLQSFSSTAWASEVDTHGKARGAFQQLVGAVRKPPLQDSPLVGIPTASKASERGRLHPAIEKGTKLSRTQLIEVRGEQALREGATQAPMLVGMPTASKASERGRLHPASPVEGATQAPTMEGRMIRKVEVQSNVGITAEVIRRLTKIESGKLYSKETIRNSLAILYKTSLFNDIQVDARRVDDEVILRYTFIEKTFLASLSIRGNWAYRAQKIQEVLAVRVGEEFVGTQWKQAVSRLMAFYQNHGYFQVTIKSTVTRSAGTNQTHVVMRMSEGQRARIKEIVFVGNKVYSDNRLRPLLWLQSRHGEFYNTKQIKKILSKLKKWYRSHGHLRAVIGPPEVAYHASTNEVTLRIPIEAETRIEVQFKGNRSLPTQKLESLLLFEEEQSYSEGVMAATSDRIADYYHSKGYAFTTVTWTSEEDPNIDTLSTTFSIKEGPLICIEQLKITGNEQISTRRLNRLLTVSPSPLSFRCKALNPDLLNQNADNLESFYKEKGFLSVDVEPTISYPGDVEHLTLSRVTIQLKIQEGIQTSVKDIHFTGNETFADSDLAKFLDLLPGSVYDRKKAPLGREQLLQHYRRNGYLYAKIKLDEQFSEDRSEVGLTYTIEENPVAHIGSIFIEGNTHTKNHVIEREFQVRPGELYNEDAVQLTRHRLSRLRFLSDVRFQPVHPIDPERKDPIKDMKLSVRERPPKAVELGIGYGDQDKFRGFAALSHRNLGGTGRSISFRTEASQIESRSLLTYIEPWVFSLPVDAKVSGEYQNQERPAYNLESVGASIGIDKDLTDSITASLKYQIEFNNFTDIPEEVLEGEDRDRINIATMNPLLIFDTRDDRFNPTSGTVNSVLLRLGAKRLGSQAQIRKVTVESTWLFPVTNRIIFVLSGRAGGVERFGESSTVPPSELFFIGGRTTVRGYRQDELGVKGDTISDITGGPTGGKVYLIGNIEIRFTLPFGLGLALFNDHGNVWFSNDTSEDIRYGDIDLKDIKSTVGAGIRYNTPIGPLRLDIGYKLDRETNLCPDCAVPVEEDPYEIHFTLGHAF